MLMDDHGLVREGLRALLERAAGIEVVAEAPTLSSAESIRPSPDVIVADLTLPDGQGVEVVRRLSIAHPDSVVLVLTMVDHPSEVERCLAAGAAGYLLKEAASDELVEAVRRVADGDAYVQPSLGAKLARWRLTSGEADARATLTERERDVLQLIALGHTNAEIAAMLYVSVRTVENHRSKLLHKLGVRTRAELVRRADELGLA